MRKRFITTLSLALSGTPIAVFAQGGDIVIPQPVETVGGFYGLICIASNWIFAFVLLVAVIVLLIGAVQFFTAGGNEDTVSTARRYVTWALVGVAVAVLARSLVAVVGSFVGADSSGFFDCG